MPAKAALQFSPTAVFLRVVLAMLLLIGVARCEDRVAKELEVPQARGPAVKPFADTNAAAIAFIFVSTECPISNRYAPEVHRLQEKFDRKVRFYLVYPNGAESNEAVNKHVKEFRHTAPALRDPHHELVRLARARVTPEGAVFSPKGELLYHGRIDDRSVDFGKERREPTTRDLENALDAVLKGKKPPVAATKAVGCPIR